MWLHGETVYITVKPREKQSYDMGRKTLFWVLDSGEPGDGLALNLTVLKSKIFSFCLSKFYMGFYRLQLLLEDNVSA